MMGAYERRGIFLRAADLMAAGRRAIAIPLAVGNTVVMKRSEDAPISCGLFLADILTEAGLPGGVLNLVRRRLGNRQLHRAALGHRPKSRPRDVPPF
jgi:acyl-CoA reductase-like NAD-dependent aldehyde dehydrogenase